MKAIFTILFFAALSGSLLTFSAATEAHTAIINYSINATQIEQKYNSSTTDKIFLTEDWGNTVEN